MPTNAFNFGPVLDATLAAAKAVLQIAQTMEIKMAEDYTGLNKVLADLKTEVTEGLTHMDELFADLMNALGSGNQAAVDAATAAVQAEIDNIKAAVARDTVPPPGP